MTKRDSVRLAEGIRTLLITLAGLGWFTISEDTINIITTVITVVVSIALSVFVGKKSAPASKE